MTIKQLIEKLNQYPETAEVYVVNKWGNWAKVTEMVPNSYSTARTPAPPITAVCLRWGSNA